MQSFPIMAGERFRDMEWQCLMNNISLQQIRCLAVSTRHGILGHLAWR